MPPKLLRQSEKARLWIRLHPEVARELKRERAETDTPVNRLIDRIVARHYGIEIAAPDSDPS